LINLCTGRGRPGSIDCIDDKPWRQPALRLFRLTTRAAALQVVSTTVLCISHEVLLESDAFRIAFIHDDPQLDTPP
jgi:hypothetical protein